MSFDSALNATVERRASQTKVGSERKEEAVPEEFLDFVGQSGIHLGSLAILDVLRNLSQKSVSLVGTLSESSDKFVDLCASDGNCLVSNRAEGKAEEKGAH